MAARVRSAGRRLAGLGTGFVEAFVRDNRVLPPVLAVLALFIIAWLLAGALMGGADQEPVAHKADLAQAEDDPGPDPRTPGVENRDIDSYAAYRSKDPFREVLAPSETTLEVPPGDRTPRDDDTGRRRGPPGNRDDNRGGAVDTDGDGLPDSRERTIGSDPNNPDTDGDGLPDGADDANGDGRPDALPGGDQPGDRAPGTRDDDLLDSGGILPLP